MFFSVEFYLKPQWNVRLGYRIVAGGSNTDAVYNFSLIQHLVLGTEFSF